MRRTILLGLGAFLLFGTQSAFAQGVDEGRLARYGHLKYLYRDEVRYGRPFYTEKSVVRGKKGRKYARYFSFSANLTGDKLAIFEEYGWTPHRLARRGGGVYRERWKYYAEGVEFVFDEFDNLVDTRYFWPEDNHID